MNVACPLAKRERKRSQERSHPCFHFNLDPLVGGKGEPTWAVIGEPLRNTQRHLSFSFSRSFSFFFWSQLTLPGQMANGTRRIFVPFQTLTGTPWTTVYISTPFLDNQKVLTAQQIRSQGSRFHAIFIDSHSYTNSTGATPDHVFPRSPYPPTMIEHVNVCLGSYSDVYAPTEPNLLNESVYFPGLPPVTRINSSAPFLPRKLTLSSPPASISHALERDRFTLPTDFVRANDQSTRLSKH